MDDLKRLHHFLDEDVLKEARLKAKTVTAKVQEKVEVTEPVDALGVTFIHFVYSKEDIDNPKVTFQADYLHHFKEDETIEGYVNPKLHFYFAPVTLDCYFRYTYDSKAPDAVNLEVYFTDFFKNGLILDRKPFERVLEKQSEYQIPGTLLGTRHVGDAFYDCFYLGKLSEPSTLRFHHSLQIFLKFHIETGSYVDSDDDYWQEIVMVERRGDQKTFVGFINYYPFYLEFDKFRVRISQQVILPPFQRRGLGGQLLHVR